MQVLPGAPGSDQAILLIFMRYSPRNRCFQTLDRYFPGQNYRYKLFAPPLASLLQKNKGIRYFEAPAGARGQRYALRIHKALVFSGVGRGPQTLHPSLRKPFGCAQQSEVPGRCFREARRRPRVPSKLSSQKQRSKVQVGKGEKGFDKCNR